MTSFALMGTLASLLGAGEFQLSPSHVRLGETVTASARFTLPGCEAEGGQAQLAVNVGTFEALHRIAADSFEATYRPPETRFPQVALLAVFCEGPGSTTLQFHRIPLHGATRLPLSARPGYDVTVEVAEMTFGPFRIDKSGKANVPIFIPPGVKEALVVGKDPRLGTLTQARVAVDVPPYNRLTVAAVTRKLEARSGASARVEAFYDGAPEGFSAAKLLTNVSSGVLSVESESGGHVIYRYTPPREASYSSAVIQLAVEGDPASTARTSILLADPPAELGRFSVGGRVGFNHALTDVSGARFGLDAFAPFQLAGHPFVFSATLGYSGAAQDVTTAVGETAQSSVALLPLSLRLGYQLLRGHRSWLHAGLGPSLTFARYSAAFASRPEDTTAANGYGVGGSAFVSAAYGLGPGHVFAELSYAYLPVRTPTFRVQAGGVFLSLGYRFALLR